MNVQDGEEVEFATRVAMSAHRTVLVALLALGVIGGACTSTAVAPASAPASPSTVAVPTSSPTASVAVPSSPGTGSLPVPSSSAAASIDIEQALAARFPRMIAGSPVEVHTIRASTFLEFMREEDPQDVPGFESFFASTGADLAAISVGSGAFTYEDSTHLLEAVRVQGADGARLLQAVVESEQQGASDPASVDVTTATVGGKPVTIVTIQGEPASYVYGSGEIVWVFESDDAALAEEVMRAIR